MPSECKDPCPEDGCSGACDREVGHPAVHKDVQGCGHQWGVRAERRSRESRKKEIAGVIDRTEPEIRTGPPPGHRDGVTYEPENDHGRLNAQQQRVWNAMVTGRWLTLAEIAFITEDPEASISARLRDLRKPRFGNHEIERRHRGDPAEGLYEYRLQQRVATPAAAEEVIY